jgi:hypothetical protein
MKKIFYFPVMVALLAFVCNIQPATANPVSAAPDEETVFVVVEQQAKFPYDSNTLMEKLTFNAKDIDPEASACRVLVQMIIEKDGTTSNHTVLRGGSGNEKIDAYAIEKVKEVLPAAKEPARQSGQPVRTKFIVPVRFQ